MGRGQGALGLVITPRILVTGASGYLGHSIFSHLRGLGFSVQKGRRPSTVNNNVSKHDKWVETDWNDEYLKFIDPFDLIIHAAGPTAANCREEPHIARAFYETTNKRLVARVAESNKALIFLSSVHVYGASQWGTEEITELSDASSDTAYARYRISAERLLLDKVKDNEIDGCILRLGNCFGINNQSKGDSNNLFIHQAVKEALDANTIHIRNSPEVTRDFVPIQYFLDVIGVLLNTGMSHPVVNIVTGKARRLIDVADAIKICVKSETKRDTIIISDSLNTEHPHTTYDATLCNSLSPYYDELFTLELQRLIRKFIPSRSMNDDFS